MPHLIVRPDGRVTQVVAVDRDNGELLGRAMLGVDLEAGKMYFGISTDATVELVEPEPATGYARVGVGTVAWPADSAPTVTGAYLVSGARGSGARGSGGPVAPARALLRRIAFGCLRRVFGVLDRVVDRAVRRSR